MTLTKKTIYFSLFFSLAAQLSQASILNVESGTEKIAGISVANSATLAAPANTQTAPEEALKLTQVGAGIREKKIVFVNVDVYLAQLFLSNPAQFKALDTKTVDKLGGQKAVALQIHFLRDLSSDKMKSAFEESLKKNNADTKSDLVQEFFKVLDQIKEGKKGQTLTILGQKISDTEDKLTVEDGNSKTYEITKPTGMIKTIFSIWLGEPTDKELAELQKKLMQKVN